jgi:carboxymethylenebutenolidase
MPVDTKIERVSRTVGKDQVVDELIISFTHNREIKIMLPGIPPTGKHVVTTCCGHEV